MNINAIILLYTAPTGPPRNVILSASSRSVSVSWDDIDCIERNGIITNYTVKFKEQTIPREVMGQIVEGQTFNASGLTPHTNYSFRVAGVNSNGTGPFTGLFSIVTDEDCMSAG